MSERTTHQRFQFAQLMEDISRAEGMAPNAGRILGFLMMSSAPVAFSTLASDLKISRGGVSENTNLLIEHGIIERVKLQGDRRDFFQLCDGRQDAIFEKSRQRALNSLEALQHFQGQETLCPVQQGRIQAIEAYLRARIAFEQSFISDASASGTGTDQ